MTVAQVVVSLPWNVPASGPVSTNTIFVDTGADTLTGAAPTIAGHVFDLYDAIPNWSSLLSGVTEVNVLDAEATTPPKRESVYQASGGFTPAGDSLPAPVAIMLGFRSATAATGARKRGHGRIRLGPFGQAALAADGHFTDAHVDDVWDAFVAFGVALAGDGYATVAGSRQYGFNLAVASKVDNRTALISKRLLPATYQRNS